jgi:Amt family ammonium transporter
MLFRSVKSNKVFSYFSALIFGMISGVVSVSALAQRVEPWEAIIIGCIGSIFYSTFSIILRKNRIDDPNEAVSCQFVCGIWSLLAVVFFDNEYGVFHNGDGEIFAT